MNDLVIYCLTTLQFWRVVFGGAALGKYDETEEKEVLFPRKAVFKVVKCYTEKRESDKLVPIIEVTEVE